MRQSAKPAGKPPAKSGARQARGSGGRTAAKPAATIAWEQEQRRWAVPAAALAGILPLAGGISVNAGLHDLPSNRIGALLFFNAHVGTLWLGSVLLGLGAVAVGATLLFMARAITARDANRLPSPTPWVIIIGAAMYALVGTLLSGTAPPFGLIAQGLTSSSVAHFATGGLQTWQHADDAFMSGGLKVISFAEIACSMLMLAAVVLVSLNAIRVGLLTRFMGYVGVFVGALTLLPIFSTLPVVQAFWFVALAVLIAGRWPAQTPPAWETGKAEPWPTMAAQREGAASARVPAGLGRGRGASARTPAPAPPPPARPAPPAAARPGDARRKRKRKR